MNVTNANTTPWMLEKHIMMMLMTGVKGNISKVLGSVRFFTVF